MLRLHRAARAELRQHAAWYEGRRPMLGEEFATEVERAIDDIAGAPERFPNWLHEPAVRRCLLRRLPFAVIYLIDDQDRSSSRSRTFAARRGHGHVGSNARL